MTPSESAERIRALPERVVTSWLLEFGYQHPPGDIAYGLSVAFEDRGERLALELERHGKRMADRATMSHAPGGRASVIR